MSETIEVTEVEVVVEQALDGEVTVEVVQEDVVVEAGFVAPGALEPGFASYSHQASATVAYQAEAAVGSTGSAAVWRIKRVEDLTGGVTRVLWAEGSTAFDHVWDDRATYAYS